MNNTETLPIVWSEYKKLTKKDKLLFDETTSTLNGVSYEPYLVSIRNYKGKNYRFKCISSVSGIKEERKAIVQIYEPMDGKSYIEEIVKI